MRSLPITIGSILLLASTTATVSIAQDGPETVLPGTKQFQKKVLATGLAAPWELTWGPDNMLWVTERTGRRITRVDPKSGAKTVAVMIDEASAPGGQDGVMGMALHPELLKGTGNDFVYVVYTYQDKTRPADPTVPDPKSPYRYLYGKVVRYRYDAKSQKLVDPSVVIAGLPEGDDHTGGRIKFGPDKKLYLTLGDQGHNQFGNFCYAIESQRLPTQKEVSEKNYEAYVGKTLRLNLDGSIPADNPKLNGVVSHVYTHGHRNPQGLDFAPDGTLYSAEHGPKTDDEINVLTSGSNYGWPHVAGFKDDKAYVYARWADAKNPPCSKLKYDDINLPAAVPQDRESSYKGSFVNPLATMFTVPTGYNFQDKACKGVDFICWPTVGISDVEYYESKGAGIPGWDKVLLVTTLKRGSLYVLPLSADGKRAAGRFSRYFQSENRYRDSAVSPDRKTIYIATDPGGLTGAADASTTAKMENPGAILAFTYTGEGSGAPAVTSSAKPQTRGEEMKPATPIVGAIAPQYTAAQAARGRKEYDSKCSVCHGTTMTNGAYGTPLAGQYFKTRWTHRSVRALYDKSQKTMPPGSPASLSADTYADIVAYILEVNGVAAGNIALRPGDAKLDKMELK